MTTTGWCGRCKGGDLNDKNCDVCHEPRALRPAINSLRAARHKVDPTLWAYLIRVEVLFCHLPCPRVLRLGTGSGGVDTEEMSEKDRFLDTVSGTANSSSPSFISSSGRSKPSGSLRCSGSLNPSSLGSLDSLLLFRSPTISLTPLLPFLLLSGFFSSLVRDVLIRLVRHLLPLDNNVEGPLPARGLRKPFQRCLLAICFMLHVNWDVFAAVLVASLSRSEGSRRKEPIPLRIPGMRCSSMNISMSDLRQSDLQRDLFCI